ncbi:hypothetical protein QEN19_001655 [Hanseniaspora menglaensis]
MAVNLLLHDPFCVLKDYPEDYSGIINTYPFKAVKQKFNPTGDYLAIGCSDGSIMIYDADTMKLILYLGNNRMLDGEIVSNKSSFFNTPACTMKNHTLSVQSLKWSSCSRYIISAGKDAKVKIWDLSCKFDCFITNSKMPIASATSCSCHNFEFEFAIWDARFYQDENKYAILCASGSCIPIILEIESGIKSKFLNLETMSYSNDNEETVNFLNDMIENEKKYGNCVSIELVDEICIVGTSKGWLMVYDLTVISSIRLIGFAKFCASSIKNIIMSDKKKHLFINSSDRVIRQCDITFLKQNNEPGFKNANIEFKHKYQDVINKLQWNSMSLSSHSGEFLIASAHGSTNETGLFLWDTSNASLVKIYENAGEELSDIDWDANKMCIVASGVDSGDIFCWSVNLPPKWASLAPDFEEVDEQVNYVEKEDEFDEFDEDLIKKDQLKFENEINLLNLLTLDKTDVRGNKNVCDLTFKIPISYQDIVHLRDNIEK